MQARRNDDDQPAVNFLDCDHCPDDVRPSLRCGWLPRERWNLDEPPFPEATVCPGYSTRLPEVIEAARSLVWARRGDLAMLYGRKEIPAVAIDAVDILEGASNETERNTMRARTEEMKRRGPR